MKINKVTFLPDNVTVEVEENTTILDAVEKADIFINNLCGGEGLCGECRVQIVQGNVHPNKHALDFLTGEEVRHGIVLACMTKVLDDITIMIPSKSQSGKDKILLTGSPLAYGESGKVVEIEKESLSSFDPIIKKIYLELPKPTLTDNVSDIDRLTRALQKATSFADFEISLSCLRNLGAKMRDSAWKITATVVRHNENGRVIKIEEGDSTGANFGLAIDVGTTTVVVQLVRLNDMKVIGTEGSRNLQARYGEDVVSRMVFACNHGNQDTVHRAVIKNINDLAGILLKENKIKARDINVVVAAGNTIMSHFLLNLPPCSIRFEPYVPTASIYPQIHAREIGIKIAREGVVEILPSVASYVGGDIVAGVLACGMADRLEIRCLIDIGTNGEIVIGNNEWLVCCSASAGPAFEGAGASSGMRAASGAIEKVEITGGNLTFETIGNVKPRGICGSGLIDIIYEFVNNGIIDRNGRFDMTRDDNRLVRNENDPSYIVVPENESATGQEITIFESEIANIIKSKGAIFAAIKSLVDYVGLSFGQLAEIYVAGGFGSSLDISKAIAIGLLPDVEPEKIRFIGNSSLSGARMALLSVPAFEKAREITRRMTNVELSNYAPFMNEFVAALFLPHTESKLFPSVKYKK